MPEVLEGDLAGNYARQAMGRLTGAFDSFVKENVPANIRLIAGTALGDRSQITENYFNAADLAAMRTAAGRAQSDHAREVGDLRGAVDHLSRQPANEPARYTIVPDRGADGSFGVKKENVSTFGDVTKEYQAKLAKAQKKLGVIQYYHYGAEPSRRLDLEGWGEAAQKSFTDANYRMLTSIGRARVDPGPAGESVVRDEYSFHGEGFDVARPTRILDEVMSKLVPKGKGRDVRINLGVMGAKGATGGW